MTGSDATRVAPATGVRPAAATAKRYRSIKQSLVDALREGRWKHGERIPSENALARRYRASVGTVRQALAELVAENVLVRQQGRGTFVASHGRDYLLAVFFPFVDRDDRKALPLGRVLGFRRAPASRDLARRLALRAGETVCVTDHLMIAPTGPLLVDRIYVPAALVPGLTRRMIAEREGTFFGLYQQRYGLHVLRTVERLSAVAADARLAGLLEVRRGTPLLRVERTALTYRDAPVEFRSRWVRTSDHRYLALLGRR